MSAGVEAAVEAVCGRGGAALGALSDGPSIAAEKASFVTILVEEDELLPALVRVQPDLAVGLLVASGIEAASAADDSDATSALAAKEANALFERLNAWRPATYVVNLGRVGGAEGEERSRAIEAVHVETLIDAARREVIEWEGDPDFGWEHPSRIVEVGVMDDSVGPIDEAFLCPRYLYAYSGGVYEYAALVPKVKKARRVAAAKLIGIDPRIDRALAGPEPKPHGENAPGED